MHKWIFFVLVVTVCVCAIRNASAATYYVATNGADANPGSIASPWRTIQHAANSIAAGDVVSVRGGVFNEAVTMNVSGNSSNQPVTFQNYPGETPVVDGTGLTVAPAQYAAGLFEFTSASYVVLQGFEIRNYQTSSGSLVPAGIDITGAPHDLTFISNRVHNIANLNPSDAANGYAIAVHGTLSQAISNLVFRGNEIYSNTLGQSETFSLDGNVNGFEISGNMVHDNNNIGIGFIGWEGVCSDPNQDYARNGVCRSNIVWNISDAANPSYPANDNSADGIYVDGASNVLIELNLVHDCDIGVELASEHHGHAARNCLCRDNLIWSNNATGLSIGGYDATVGETWNCVITHNTLYQNDTLQLGNGEFELQYSPLSNTFTHNILFANSQGLLISDYFTQNSANTLDWNLYFTSAGAANSAWMWKNASYTSLTNWVNGTTNDSHSLFADPLFVNADAGNFHLSLSSPALNAGDPAFQPVTSATPETDIDLQSRIADGRTDIGADELNIFRATLGATSPTTGAIQLQLSGEPGHAFAWQQSSAFSNWTAFLTNFTANTYWTATGSIAVTNFTLAPAQFFRARMTQ